MKSANLKKIHCQKCYLYNHLSHLSKNNVEASVIAASHNVNVAAVNVISLNCWERALGIGTLALYIGTVAVL